jgi:hypothetical protein
MTDDKARSGNTSPPDPKHLSGTVLEHDENPECYRCGKSGAADELTAYITSGSKVEEYLCDRCLTAVDPL